MLQNKLSSETAEMKVKPRTNLRHIQIQQLQDEIDKLALLVNEAKRQSDRIQAAADALGDAVLISFDEALLSGIDKRSRLRKIES